MKINSRASFFFIIQRKTEQ